MTAGVSASEAEARLRVRDYHERSKNLAGAGAAPRRVDAALVPRQYKRYIGLPEVNLPAPRDDSGVPFFAALRGPEGGGRGCTAADLAALLHFSNGILRRRRLDGREVEFRAASCTGAQYHLELYAVCGEIAPGIGAGVYHYDVPSASLRLLRGGDYRAMLADACCETKLAGIQAGIIVSSTFWRNAWRYEERAYRHAFWDGGTLLANLLALAGARRLSPRLRASFVDDRLNGLLGLDATREAAITVVTLGAAAPAPSRAPIEPLTAPAEPLSRAEIEYPAVWQTHAATSLPDCEAVERLRRLDPPPAARPAPPLPEGEGDSLEEVIRRRLSARRFADRPLSLSNFEALLAVALAPVAGADLPAGVLEVRLIVHAVQGLQPGTYAAGEDGRLQALASGDFRAESAHLALDQDAAGRAALNVYFVTGLERVFAHAGARGYRAVQLEAGIRSGRLYLAATALGLRATALTFYDDAAAHFLGLPGDAALLMLMAIGT